MSNKQKVIDQCIALAGLAQAVRVVQHIAWKGTTNNSDFKILIASLLKVDAPSAAAVYGGSFELNSGLRFLSHQIDPAHREKDPEFVNLVLNVMSLQLRLEKDQRILHDLGEKTQALASDYADLNFYDDDAIFEKVLEACSETYKQTLSRLPNRIQVKGEPRYLKEPGNQVKVRAALLAAIRACFLWRQSGGSRWHFIFKKKILLEGIRYLISNPIRE